jgi:hypothetical protein
LSTDVLERIVPDLVAAAPKIRLVYGQVALVNEQCEVLEIVGQPWERIRHRFFQEMVIPHQGVFHNRALFLNGGFDESFRFAGDYELLLRELKQKDALFREVVVAGMQLGGVSNTPVQTLAVLREFARARQKLGVTTIPLHWWWTYIKALTRRILTNMLGDKRARYVTDIYRRITRRPPIWMR